MEFEKKDLKKSLLAGDSQTGQHDEPDEKGGWLKCCKKLDNKTVLLIICCLFAAFATSEMIGALVSIEILYFEFHFAIL